jgi:3-methyl-2-oxobutanoate hydroxymethyltransferase
LEPRRTTTADVRKAKSLGTRIPVVTAYDYSSAKLVDSAEIPVILVGDSLAQTMLGHADTLAATMDDMVRASASVARGAPRALIVADMPFMSYQASVEDALRNAGRLLKEGGAQAVKVEGGAPVVETVRAFDAAGIAVMGHLGLTPQSVHKLGGYAVQAKAAAEAKQLVDDALGLEAAGVFAIVLELIPAELAEVVTQRLSIPTIGIGSGLPCDGEVQVWHDVLGLSLDFNPRHAAKFCEAGQVIVDALSRYATDVRENRFPTEAQTSHSTYTLRLDGESESGVPEE